MSDSQRLLRAATIGEAWVVIAKNIMESGATSSYDGLAMRELLIVTVVVDQPSTTDTIIERFADPERLAWMKANFVDQRDVVELGDASSYAARLRNYDGAGHDQLRWVCDRLGRDPRSRSATITTFQPLTDASYIPCVSLLDFFVDNDALQLVVYAHSIDFGAKGYANLLELAVIQHEVARSLTRAVGPLTMIVKSAHVYDSEATYVTSVLENFT